MVYSVVLSARAAEALADLLEDPESPYSPAARLAYVRAIRTRCESLDLLPHRFAEVTIRGRQFRHFSYKAHRVFYRVDEPTKTVFVIAIIAGRMEMDRQL